MTPTKLYSLLLILAAAFYSGCSSTSTDSASNEPVTSPPMVATPDPEPEVVPEPDPEIVDIVVESEPANIEELVETVELEPEVVEPETLTILGFIKYIELEGGFFGIMTEDGTKFFPEYIEQDFKQDGLGVRVLAKPQEQILGIQMWGTPIEILKIEAN